MHEVYMFGRQNATNNLDLKNSSIRTGATVPAQQVAPTDLGEKNMNDELPPGAKHNEALFIHLEISLRKRCYIWGGWI